MNGLGARIAAARKNAALSQATLGQRLGVGQTAVSYWEKDKREPGLTELIGLARELGVTLAHLAGTDTSDAESYWVGFRAGWLACAARAMSAVALDPTRFPARGERTAAGMPGPRPGPWVTVDGRTVADWFAIRPDAVIDGALGPEAGGVS